MLRNDNIQWRVTLTLCLLCTNDVIASVMKPNILDALDEIAGYDLTEKEMHRYHIWPQGIIPYYIDDFSFDKVLRDRVRFYLDQIGKVTGLRFMEIPQPPEDDQNRWVFFLNRKGRLRCADVSYSNFTSEGVQRVVLGYDCIKSEDLAEVILSLVGVAPQHNSPDRDNYITVNWKNILPDKHYLFKKMQPEEWMFKKLEYDFASGGHYNTHKYTLNGAETISPKNPETYKEGGKGLSVMDIKKIRTVYNYISYKGKNQIKVPECSKLFVTGSNFSNYKPATKSDKRPEKLNSPTPSDDLSSEKTNNMSMEVNSSEDSKLKHEKDDNRNQSDVQLKDSKDKIEIEDKNIEDETDNENQIKNVVTEKVKIEASNDTKNDSGSDTDNESQHINSPKTKKISTKSEKKATLLKFGRSVTYGKKYNLKKKLLSSSDYESTKSEKKATLLKFGRSVTYGKKYNLKKKLLSSSDYESTKSEKKATLLKFGRSVTYGKKYNLKKKLLSSSDCESTKSEKKATLLKFGRSVTYGKKYNLKKKLLSRSDYETGDEEKNN